MPDNLAYSQFAHNQHLLSTPLTIGLVQQLSTMQDGPSEDVDAAGDELIGLLDLADQSLEHLARQDVLVPAMDMEVTSVSRQKSTVGRSPAAVYVVTNEMIRRSGARSIPEALRLAPGVFVARIDQNKWSVSIRGFADRYSNKLLVQVDGRSIYTQLFGGVYWDEQEMLLEDVERIEVIRGPGATVWGANAVNGVINIITKSSADTKGVYASAAVGNELQGFAATRIGGSNARGDFNWRIWGRWKDRDDGFRENVPTYDNSHNALMGFRADWTPNCCDTLTLQANVYNGKNGTAVDVGGFGMLDYEEQFDGGYLRGRWLHEIDDERNYAVQFYYDQSRRTDLPLDQDTDVYDIDFQNRFPLGDRNRIIWGTRYRRVSDNLVSMFTPDAILFTPGSRTTDLVSAFLQDEIELVEDEWFFTIGAKIESNGFTGFEVQPNARLLWAIDERRSMWGAVSRAVRTPARSDHDIRFGFPPYYTFGNPELGSEELIAYEIGYRAQPIDEFSWDIALFYNVYDDLRTEAPLGLSQIWINDIHGDTYGLEISAKTQLTRAWQLTGWYSFLQSCMAGGPTSGSSGGILEGSDPQNQVFLSLSRNIGCNWDLDLFSRYVDWLEYKSIPSYISMNARLAWHPNSQLEVSIVAHDLLAPNHQESPDGGLDVMYTQVQRGAYGMLTWRY